MPTHCSGSRRTTRPSISSSSTSPTRRTSRSGKLYSASFYRLLDRHLAAGGLAAIQSTSPLYARRSFWCIVTTLESRRPAGDALPCAGSLRSASGASSSPVAARTGRRSPTTSHTRFLTRETTPGLFVFPRDMERVDAEVNRLNNQVLVRYFEQEWRQVIR
jgi:spermidine synthase